MSSSDKLANTNFSSLAEMMSVYAVEAVRVAWNDHRVRFDFSPDSIEGLEQILDGQAAADLEYQTRLWGSYLGEVVRREFGGEWELTAHPGGSASAVPALVVRGSRLYPLMKAFRRLTMGKDE